MGVAGPSLQGLYGRPKRGVRPNEPLIVHSSAADERLRKAIKHNVLAPARHGNQVPARKKHQQSGALLAPLLEDPRVIHPNNVRELDRWSKLVVIHEDHTIAVKYRHYAHADVNRPGAWTKKKNGQPARVGTTDSFIQLSPGPHSPVNAPDKMPYQHVHNTSANTLSKVPRCPNRSDPRTQIPGVSACICSIRNP